MGLCARSVRRESIGGGGVGKLGRLGVGEGEKIRALRGECS